MATAVALVATACTSGGAHSAASPPAGAPSTSRTVTPPACVGCGGRIIAAAGSWPKCLNPITECADDPWYRYMFKALIFPRLTQWSNRMELQASPLITEVPSLSNGGITENPFSITYHLNPKAVWADGTAITCADVTFTWAAMLYTSDRRFIYYDGFGSGVPLTKVECPESTTVILRLAKVFAPWPNLFGGADGFVLEKSAFATVPGFPDKPDLKDAFKDSIPFSGGPWVLHRWSKEQATLVRNPRYWDRKTYIDQVTFVPKKTSDQEAGLRDNDVNVVFQPSPTATQSSSFRADPSLDVAAGPDEWADALWFNLDDPVVGDVRIRRALAYAFDRDAVARGVPGLIDPNAEPNDCGPWVPGQGPWCPTPGPFDADTYDAAHAMSVLEAAGYDCSKVADGGFCMKRGRPLTITVSTTIGDVGRATAVSLLETSALAAGVNVQLRTYPSTELFSDLLPQAKFQIALYKDNTGVRFGADFEGGYSSAEYVGDPSVSSMFASNQIPMRANGFAGGNFVRWRNHRADALMLRSDVDLDQAARASDTQAIGRLLAQDLPMLPLYSTPSLAAWRSAGLAGIDPNDVSSPYGFFFGMNRWFSTG